MSKFNKTCLRNEIKINDSPPPSPPPEKVPKNTISKYHTKCTQNEIKIIDSLPPSPPPELKTYGHSAPSKYHIKCTEDGLHKKKIPVLPPSPPPEPIEIQKIQRSSLLDVLTTETDCACAVVARAVRSHVHMNLGLQEKREQINAIGSESTDDISRQSDSIN